MATTLDGYIMGVWCGMVWSRMVWYGMVWYGMVRYGMVWYGMEWNGMERNGTERNGGKDLCFSRQYQLLLPFYNTYPLRPGGGGHSTFLSEYVPRRFPTRAELRPEK